MNVNRIESRQVQRIKGFRRQLPLPLDPNLCGDVRVNEFAEFSPILTIQRSNSMLSEVSRAVRGPQPKIRQYFERQPQPPLTHGSITGATQSLPFSPPARRALFVGMEGIMPLPINVLVICAGKEAQNKFTEILRMAGMRAVCCTNLREARYALGKQQIQAVICEEILSDGSFRELIHQGGSISEEIPVIVFSNSGEWDTYLRVIRAGAFDCIAYPPVQTEVARILWQALRQTKHHSELAMAST